MTAVAVAVGSFPSLFSSAIGQGARLSWVPIRLFRRGVVQGVPTRPFAEEREVGSETLLQWRHRLPATGLALLPTEPLPEARGEEG